MYVLGAVEVYCEKDGCGDDEGRHIGLDSTELVGIEVRSPVCFGIVV